NDPVQPREEPHGPARSARRPEAPMTLNLGESFRTAMSDVWGHKLRTVLTLLGIFLGTMAIVVMSSFLDGIVLTVWRGFEGLGFDGVVFVEHRGARGLREQ